MSLAYKLFGIPKNLDEFIHKIKSKSVKYVQIGIYHYRKDGSEAHSVALKAGKYSFEYKDYPHDEYIHTKEENLMKLRKHLDALEDSIDIAKKLKNKGFEIIIRNKGHDIKNPAAELTELEQLFTTKHKELIAGA